MYTAGRRHAMKLLSVVVPCYNEEENVPYFYEELMKRESFFTDKGVELEIIYVDVGCMTKMSACIWFLFRETLEKKRASMRDCPRRRGILSF